MKFIDDDFVLRKVIIMIESGKIIDMVNLVVGGLRIVLIFIKS